MVGGSARGLGSDIRSPRGSARIMGCRRRRRVRLQDASSAYPPASWTAARLPCSSSIQPLSTSCRWPAPTISSGPGSKDGRVEHEGFALRAAEPAVVADELFEGRHLAGDRVGLADDIDVRRVDELRRAQEMPWRRADRRAPGDPRRRRSRREAGTPRARRSPPGRAPRTRRGRSRCPDDRPDPGSGAGRRRRAARGSCALSTCGKEIRPRLPEASTMTSAASGTDPSRSGARDFVVSRSTSPFGHARLEQPAQHAPRCAIRPGRLRSGRG